MLQIIENNYPNSHWVGTAKMGSSTDQPTAHFTPLDTNNQNNKMNMNGNTNKDNIDDDISVLDEQLLE